MKTYPQKNDVINDGILKKQDTIFIFTKKLNTEFIVVTDHKEIHFRMENKFTFRNIYYYYFHAIQYL